MCINLYRHTKVSVLQETQAGEPFAYHYIPIPQKEGRDIVIGFGGPEIACWPLVHKFAGSNPAEAVGFFRAKKSSARLPSEGK